MRAESAPKFIILGAAAVFAVGAEGAAMAKQRAGGRLAVARPTNARLLVCARLQAGANEAYPPGFRKRRSCWSSSVFTVAATSTKSSVTDMITWMFCNPMAVIKR
jgi:hypothetical protein